MRGMQRTLKNILPIALKIGASRDVYKAELIAGGKAQIRLRTKFDLEPQGSHLHLNILSSSVVGRRHNWVCCDTDAGGLPAHRQFPRCEPPLVSCQATVENPIRLGSNRSSQHQYPTTTGSFP
jgi:hypothetical protein